MLLWENNRSFQNQQDNDVSTLETLICTGSPNLEKPMKDTVKGMVRKTERKTRKSQWSRKDEDSRRKQTTVRTSEVTQNEEWKRKYRIWHEEVPDDHSPRSSGAETTWRGFKGGLKERKHIHHNDFIKFGKGKKETSREVTWVENQTVSFSFFLLFSGWKRTNNVFRWKGIKSLHLLDRKGNWWSKPPKGGKRQDKNVTGNLSWLGKDS